MHVLHTKFVRASGEVILGTLKYLDMHVSDEFFVRASGEAILGTLKYLDMHFSDENCFAPPARRF